MNDVHFSSKTVEWETPQDFFDKLNAEFGFTLDACATVENAKCPKFYTIRENGLAQSFAGGGHKWNAPFPCAVVIFRPPVTPPNERKGG